MFGAYTLRGWAQRLDVWQDGTVITRSDDQAPEHPVVGIVCSSDFPEPALIGEVLAVGHDRDPSTIFVIRDRDKLAKVALDELNLEYVTATLNPHYKYEFPAHGDKQARSVDDRAGMREIELVDCCTRVIVFRTPATATLDYFSDSRWAEKVRVIERGKAKKKTYKKGRAPQ